MRQVFITKAGPPEVLQVRESPDPDAGKGEIRVRVKATGINFADLSARMGMYPDMPPIPCVVGYETAGVIDQVGAGVSDFSVGDRVVAMPHFGGHTDTLVVPAGQAYPMSAKMSFEEGAALCVAYLTAHHMMHFVGYTRPGSTVLIHSVAGGVGLAALDLARRQNCVVLGTCSKSKFEFVKERGCAHPLDSQGDYVSAAREIVGKRGIDLILDPLGGFSWRDSYGLIGPGGRMVCFGASALQGSGKTRNLFRAIWELIRMKWFNPLSLMNENKTVCGVNMANLFDRLDLLRPQFAALMEMYDRGEIKPFVDKTFKLEEAAAAHHYLHDRKARGKVLLIP